MKTHLIQFLSKLELSLFKAGLPGWSLISFVRTIAHRRLTRFSIDKDGDYVNSQSDGVIVSLEPIRTDLRSVKSRISDYWLVDYKLRPGDTVLDVGAGIGDDAWAFAQYVGPSGRVFAFEASPRTARCLAKTVQRSGLKNVQTHEVAVTDRAGRVLITDDLADHQNSLIINQGQHSVEVSAITLDEFVKSNLIDNIDLLKMNIEGAEKPALLGFRREFGRVRNVAIACHDWIADLGHSESYRTRDFVLDFLKSQGFIVHQRVEDNRPWLQDTLYASRRV